MNRNNSSLTQSSNVSRRSSSLSTSTEKLSRETSIQSTSSNFTEDEEIPSSSVLKPSKIKKFFDQLTNIPSSFNGFFQKNLSDEKKLDQKKQDEKKRDGKKLKPFTTKNVTRASIRGRNNFNRASLKKIKRTEDNNQLSNISPDTKKVPPKLAHQNSTPNQIKEAMIWDTITLLPQRTQEAIEYCETQLNTQEQSFDIQMIFGENNAIRKFMILLENEQILNCTLMQKNQSQKQEELSKEQKEILLQNEKDYEVLHARYQRFFDINKKILKTMQSSGQILEKPLKKRNEAIVARSELKNLRNYLKCIYAVSLQTKAMLETPYNERQALYDECITWLNIYLKRKKIKDFLNHETMEHYLPKKFIAQTMKTDAMIEKPVQSNALSLKQLTNRYEQSWVKQLAELFSELFSELSEEEEKAIKLETEIWFFRDFYQFLTKPDDTLSDQFKKLHPNAQKRSKKEIQSFQSTYGNFAKALSTHHHVLMKNIKDNAYAPYKKLACIKEMKDFLKKHKNILDDLKNYISFILDQRNMLKKSTGDRKNNIQQLIEKSRAACETMFGKKYKWKIENKIELFTGIIDHFQKNIPKQNIKLFPQALYDEIEDYCMAFKEAFIFMYSLAEKKKSRPLSGTTATISQQSKRSIALYIQLTSYLNVLNNKDIFPDHCPDSDITWNGYQLSISMILLRHFITKITTCAYDNNSQLKNTTLKICIQALNTSLKEQHIKATVQEIQASFSNPLQRTASVNNMRSSFLFSSKEPPRIHKVASLQNMQNIRHNC